MIEEYSIGDTKNVQYHTPAGLLPFGLSLKLAYSPDTSSNDVAALNAQGGTGGAGNGTFYDYPAAGTAFGTTAATTQSANIGRTMTSYQVTAAPVDGLTVGASYSDIDGAASPEGAIAQNPESGSAFAKYVFGPATVAYGKAWIAPAIAMVETNSVEFFENTKYSIAVNANENFSVAYSMETSEANFKTAATANVELESSSISAAYTVGGMTLAVAQASHNNVGYVTNRDAKTTLLNISMAF